MRTSTLAIVVAVVIIAVLGFFVWRLKIDNRAARVGATPSPSADASATPTPTPTFSPVKVNFTKTGNIVGSKEQGFGFIYEEPGKPALSASLKFTNGSICNSGVGFVSCDRATWTAGDRVTVEGNKSGDTVTVLRLYKVFSQ
jgi:hypothetical protein